MELYVGMLIFGVIIFVIANILASKENYWLYKAVMYCAVVVGMALITISIVQLLNIPIIEMIKEG